MAGTNLTERSEIKNGMLKSSLWEEIHRYYQGKLLSLIVLQGMSYLRKGWCCSTGAKVGT